MRERKRAGNRAAVIDAAFELFGERGYDDVTVADICDTADIGRRTFFRYFASKEDLLRVPVQEMAARVTASITAAPAAFTDGQAVRAAMTDLARYALERRAQLELYRRITTTSSTLRFSPLWHLPEQEQLRLLRRLQTRRGRTEVPDYVTRLLVARAVAAFRVWIDETLDFTGAHADTAARQLFDQIFDADPWLTTD